MLEYRGRLAMRRVTAIAALVTLQAIAASELVAETPERPLLTLERIFEDEDFETKRFGPARWLEDGSGYTTLESSAAFEEARDIVRYDPSTGNRVILVPAEALTPSEGEEPLSIDDYQWSDDGTQLLVFTNTTKVWRRNTRGDYWLLHLESGALQKLGGEAGESTMMFAKFSPDGTRVAWVDFTDQGPLRPGPRGPRGQPAHRRRARRHHQRHLGLGLRRGIRRPGRFPLEPRRPPYRLLAVRLRRCRAPSTSSTTPTPSTPNSRRCPTRRSEPPTRHAASG